MDRLPTVFVSHGSPMHALEGGAAAAAWRGLGERLGRPEALLVVSAHWDSARPMLTGAARPATIHDFSGFPQPLYGLRYPAPGAPETARRAQALLRRAGFDAGIDEARGLDHGAWVPLLHMYPRADVPVFQLSLQVSQGPRHAWAIGRALEALAGEGVLVIGSGHLTHNLNDYFRGIGGAAAGYAAEFQDWVAGRVSTGDTEALMAYRTRAPHASRAHPTEEHFLPLFAAMAAAGTDAPAERVFDGIDAGVLAMDAYLFG